jgi:transposase
LPPKTPEANPIENIWNILKGRLNNRGIFRNNNELWNAIRNEWEDIQQNGVELCESLVDSMLNRMQSVINSNGGFTKY